MQSLSVQRSKRKYILLLLGCLGFVIAGAFIIRSGGTHRHSATSALWIGWSTIVFFGAGIPIALWQLFDGRPRLQIDGNGILDRRLGVGPIPWSEITGAYLKSAAGNAFICLDVKDPEKWRQKMSKAQRMLVAGNVMLGYTALVLNVSDVKEDPAAILDLILKNLTTWHDTRSQFAGWTG
ncbi:hypothetical protein PIN31115_04247 [Pandoraea iniqua]|uniref:Uncharacterized protein n=1 Tax=Pandoraea iniqua TaxID=2508288 RepID=A0A5E4Y4N2_9BURK|nr:STM3941 family protein [Pandoraea iniqua]VVE43338.1 hypothetical protein PIN31115_04247 [Pandoraea iniqua]